MDENEEPREGEGEEQVNKKAIASALAEMIVNTPLDKLAAWTSLPLDQVLPCSMAKVYAQETRELCKLAIASQKLYNKNWLKWHPGDADKLIDPDTDWRFKIPNEMTIVEQFLEQYYLHRRSINSDFKMGLFTLAQAELESKEPDKKDEWGNVPIQ